MVSPMALTSRAGIPPIESEDDIKVPHDHDVLCGRGGSINSWKGNEFFRALVEKRKRVYLTARFKREKRLIASSIVQEIQLLDPPGRFLSRDTKKGTWFVIDDDKARDKVSQALRENAPSIRAEIETEISGQRADSQRYQHDSQHPPLNAPPSPYYPQGSGYFSYHGYTEQSPHPGSPVPPPPGYYHPGYSFGQWSSGRSELLRARHRSPTSASSEPKQQEAFSFSLLARAATPKPEQRGQQTQLEHSQLPPPSPRVQAIHKFAPAESQQDDKSIFDATAELMSAILPSSLASWTKDAFSIGGGMSLTSNRIDLEDNISVASKPIQYVHQPEETQSVISRARSVRFKDERSISGRSLELPKHSKPPRIMHSSQINYPRRPKRTSICASQPNIGRASNFRTNSPLAPVSSVHLNDHNDGMISLISTEGMNSIVEEGLLMDEYERIMEKKDNEEFEACDPTDPETLALSQRQKASRWDSLGDDTSKSMLTAVANQIVMGLGSWDASTIIACGPDNEPVSIGVPPEVAGYFDSMAVEIEGQEVQLVDMMEVQQERGGSSIIEDRMPPHEKERQLQVDWPARIGSCHSFFNDSFAGASLFSPGKNSRGISPASSMDMDVSSGTDPFSCASSVGGASLCQVFDAEALTKDGHSLSPSMPIGLLLSKMPVRERSFLLNRSQEGCEQDHFPFMTADNEKLMDGSTSTIGSKKPLERQPSGVMAWENHKKE